MTSSSQSIPRSKSDQLWDVVHLQLPHRHHHAGAHLAVAALPLPGLQVSADGVYVQDDAPVQLLWAHDDTCVSSASEKPAR